MFTKIIDFICDWIEPCLVSFFLMVGLFLILWGFYSIFILLGPASLLILVVWFVLAVILKGVKVKW
jgi:hypothetical protein